MQDGGVQSIARAARVLRALEPASGGGMSLGELAAATDLPKSTVHRLVGSLADEDLVSYGPDGRARLGGGIVRLAAAAGRALRDELRPLLVELNRELDETVDAAVLDGTTARFIDQVAAPHRLQAVSAVGERFPLHCTANGKALLAALPDDEALESLPARLERMTPATITSRSALLDELAAVRRDGVAYDREEHTEGICAAGAAVVAPGAGTLAAISIPVPAQRFAREGERYATRLRTAVASLS